MHKQKEAQEGRVLLNVGGYRYKTSVQTLRRLPHTFFDAYFSGRYAQDVCADGSIFIDRDGEHFGQVLQYLRDGVVSVAEQEASELDVGVLRWLKREFDFTASSSWRSSRRWPLQSGDMMQMIQFWQLRSVTMSQVVCGGRRHRWPPLGDHLLSVASVVNFMRSAVMMLKVIIWRVSSATIQV
jgi:hypothetical protein